MARRRTSRRARGVVRESVVALALSAILVAVLIHRAQGLSWLAWLPSWLLGDRVAGPMVGRAPPKGQQVGGGQHGRERMSEHPGSGAASPQVDARPAVSAVAKDRSLRPLPAGAGSLQSNPHVALGIPTDADPSDDILLDEHSFVVSYNPERNGPNWVSWQLERSHLGSVRRANHFRSDPLLPPVYYHVEPQDYVHSGYDRGHLCPSGDRTRDEVSNSTTFLMTNMLPQVHEVNSGPWEKLEEHERAAVNQDDAILNIVAGGVFEKSARTIGHNVSVPRALYKIVVRLSRGQRPAEISPDVEVLAVVIPNEASSGRRPWTDFATTVAEVERQTGYEFFSSIPPAVRAEIEAKPMRPLAMQ